MITYLAGTKVFKLDTKDLSYLLRITEYGLLEHLYFGPFLTDEQYPDLLSKVKYNHGSEIIYPDPTSPTRNLDMERLEYSFVGYGDYRPLPSEIIFPDGSYQSHFVYARHYDYETSTLPLPQGRSANARLAIVLRDELLNVEIELIYSVYDDCNCFGRQVNLINHNESVLKIKKLLSAQLDLLDKEYCWLSFDGTWGKEMQTHQRNIAIGTYSQMSTTGVSSNRTNPGFILMQQGTGEQVGRCYGFNLLYSGNHYSFAHRTVDGLIRLGIGINDFCFEQTLAMDESFLTPEAVLSFSEYGLNGLSQNLHEFVNHHLIAPQFRVARPIVINSWETYGFDFNPHKLVTLAKRAKELGMEMLVLDDGWFGNRNHDHAGLGDYTFNPKTLPHGLGPVIQKINDCGLKFGLWVEPEMINTDSDLFRSHPDWALTVPGQPSYLGHNQLVLNLVNPEVQDYIIKNLTNLLTNYKIAYLKWDMNRVISQFYDPSLRTQGAYLHQYVLSLYHILSIITINFPMVLIESCSSGGNRFDYGMLYYTPQIWCSDCTDATQRLSIQKGLSYLYPPSCHSNHVSYAPNFATLRPTSLHSRFNVALQGILGYELNLNLLTKAERTAIKQDVQFYKQHRHLLQFGQFHRHDLVNDYTHIHEFTHHHQSLMIRYQTLTPAVPELEIFKTYAKLQPEQSYQVRLEKKTYSLDRFGLVILHALPRGVPKWVVTNPFWFKILTKVYHLTQEPVAINATGQALMQGVNLTQQFMSSGWDPSVRLLRDHESERYFLTENENACGKNGS